MPQAIPIRAETVGLAFQQQLAATYALKSKSKRKAEFNRMKRTLIGLRIVPANFDIVYITWGVDKNGCETIVVTGDDRESTATV
jgi:hypothetical protein